VQINAQLIAFIQDITKAELNLNLLTFGGGEVIITHCQRVITAGDDVGILKKDIGIGR